MLLLRISILVWFSMLGTLANAFDNFDECGQLQKLITNNIGLIGADNNLPFETRNNYGFNFWPDEVGEIPTRIQNIYTKTRDNYDYDMEDFNELVMNDLFKINGKPLSEMTYEQFLEETSEGPVELEVFNYDKKFKFAKDDYEVLKVLLTPKIKAIYEISPKDGRFGSNFSLDTYWRDERLLTIAQQVFQEGSKLDPNYNDSGDILFGYYCDLTEDFMIVNRILYPKIEPNKFRSEIDREQSSFTLSYFPADDTEDHVVEFTQKQNFQGFINNDFDLEMFPFDKQYLDIEFVPVEAEVNSGITLEFLLSEVGEESIHTAFYEFYNNSWKAVDYFHEAKYIWSDFVEQRVNSYEVSIFLERNVEYYIFKLMLPIILLLTLTWAIFWIDIRDLETRITMSIVTFLALIAYNFVIDNDLAKLSYLTFLDAVILVSYLFAGLPTFMAIYCKRQIAKNNTEWSKKINSLSRIGFPLTYALSVGFLLMGFDINPLESFLKIGVD